MAVEGSVDCSADVVVNFGGSLYVSVGLITVISMCGGLSGILAAALLYVFCMKPLMLTRQGYNARRLLEPDVGNMEGNHSDGVSNRKKASSGTTDDKVSQQPPLNSDVAAFASRAKVVYPINQKYRPLADGASNPSLHEHTKLPPMPNEDSSSSSSEEPDNNDDNPFVSSMVVPSSLQNQSFTRVPHYPLSLTLTGFEARISLYCLALQDLQCHCSQLEDEKHLIFLHMVKMILGCRFPKDKNDADFTKNIIQKQEQELNELTKQRPKSLTEETSHAASCSLEEIERAQKDLFEHSLQTSKSFSRQVEGLCQLLQKKTSIFSPREAQDVNVSLTQTLVFVEKHLMKVQEASLKSTLEKLLWWEELTRLFQTQPALLRWEVDLRQSLITATLEQLASDSILKFSHVERMLSEIQAAVAEGLQQSSEKCMKKTKELVNKKCSEKESKKKKLQRSQMNERNRVLELGEAHSDLQELATVCQELFMKHRKQISDLELQWDSKVAEALGDLWKKLRSSWSKRLGETAKDVFLNTVSAQTSLSADRCEKLWQDLEQELSVQLQQMEYATKQQLEDIRTELDEDGKMWNEEIALTRACLKHLGEQQTKILQAMVARQGYSLSRETGKLLEGKHEHLLMLVQRSFVFRHFCLHMQKEMRLSRLKTLSQKDFRALLVEGASKSQACSNSALKNSSTSLAEGALLGNNLQQEFLSELETATELLQSHAQLVLGNALSHAIQQRMEAMPTQSHTSNKQDVGTKNYLMEAAAESVYVTKESLLALVQNYYSQLQSITIKLEQDHSSLNQETKERQDRSSLLSRTLLKELVNWGKKPASAEFQQRVELNKRKVLEQTHLDQEIIYEELRQTKVALDQTMERIKAELMEAEDNFIMELASLARVPIRSSAMEPSGEEEDLDEHSTPKLDLLLLNPALDPALNPSLTPSFVPPEVTSKSKKRERESRVI
uniref:Ellis van Creveld syndrome n=1 Tax=Nothobranchius kuhntae TaxID=321403 RepID=A0A1A8JX95_NOTKU